MLKIYVVIAVLKYLIIAETTDEKCETSLGARHGGELPESAFSASTFSSGYFPSNGRLGGSSGWIPKVHDPADRIRLDYLQVDLGSVRTVSGVVTEGFGQFFTKSFLLKFSINGTYFEIFSNVKQFQLFEGGTGSSVAVINKLPCYVRARFIQFIPQNYYKGIALKVDVLGCSTDVPTVALAADFTASQISSSRLRLTWQQIGAGVSYFQVVYHPTADLGSTIGIDEPAKTESGNFTEPITGLLSCTHYSFVLRVFDHSNCGIPQVHVTTATTDPGFPIPAQNIRSDTSIGGTIALRWDKSRAGYLCAANITHYELFYKTLFPAGPTMNVSVPTSSDASEVLYTLAGLKGWTKYHLEIYAVNSLGRSDPATVFVDTEGKPPDEAPTITSAVSNDPEQVTLEWKNPPVEKVHGDIRGYSIFYRKVPHDTAPNSVWTEVTPVSLDTKATITYGLDKWSQYEFFVVLHNLKYNISSETVKVLVTGLAPGLAPANLNAPLVETTHVELSWQAVPSEYIPEVFQGYEVYFGRENGLLQVSPNGTTMETFYTLYGLLPGSKYRFEVAAVSNRKAGPRSNTLQVETRKKPLPRPEIIRLSSPSPGKISVLWRLDDLTVVVSGFKVHYKKAGAFPWSTLDVGGSREADIPNLEEWFQYDLKLELLSEGRSIETVPQKVTVVGAAPGKAPYVRGTVSCGFDCIDIFWEPVEPVFVWGDIVGYEIRARPVNEPADSSHDSFSPSPNKTIQQLTQDTAYSISVAAKTSGGIGPFSKVFESRTRRVERLDAPKMNRVDAQEPRQLDISWFEDSTWRQHGLFYKINVTNTVTNEIIRATTSKPGNAAGILKETVLNLEPYTMYIVNVRACISTYCGATSDDVFVFTKEEAPSPPRDLVINVYDENVTITWSRPSVVPGILRSYRLNIKYQASGLPVKNYPKDFPNSTDWVVLTDIPAFNSYTTELTARTILESQPFVGSFLTSEARPGPPTNVLVILLKDGKMMSIRWDPPQVPNGFILNYMVHYVGTKSYNSQYRSNISRELAAEVETLRVEDLSPGTSYSVQVQARTAKGYGGLSQPMFVHTPIAAPESPPEPQLFPSETTSSSITVKLLKVIPKFGEIAIYQVIVEKVLTDDIDNKVTRKRRASASVPSAVHDYETAKKLDERFYIAAEVHEEKVPGKFVVGDGRIYNGYKNAALEPKTSYRIYVRAGSISQETGMLFGPFSSIGALVTTGSPESPKDGFPIPMPILIGVAAAVFILIIVIIIIVFYIRSNKRKQKEGVDPYEMEWVKLQPASVEPGPASPRPLSLTGDYPINPNHPPIPVANFVKQVQKLHKGDNSGFKAEFSELGIGKEYSWDVAHLTENRPKNRYANIVAYDKSRVVLPKIDGVPGSDYINASYVDGYRKPNAYIATQGPLPGTFNDLWRMVWEVRSAVLVMVTNLQEKNKVKCHKYWPDDCTQYGDIIVTLSRKDPFAVYTIRTFKLEKIGSSEVREVKQFHFTAWPDHGVPAYGTTILAFMKRVRSYQIADTGPMIVHCSAGVGRTGTYIAIDSMLDRMAQQNTVDIFNFVASMRTRRIAMVQTEDQYVFVHEAISEAIVAGDTQIDARDLPSALKKLEIIEPDSRVSGFEVQWKMLNQASHTLPKTAYHLAMQQENQEKNRYSTVLPVDANRVLLTLINESENSTYINAVYVDGYRQKNAFILTQCPLPTTVADFWRMICEHGCSSMVMLNSLDEGDDYARFWPDSGSRQFDMITVECCGDAKDDGIDAEPKMKPMFRTPSAELFVRTFRVSDARNPLVYLVVKLFQYQGWTETRVPNSYKAVISLITQLERWQSSSGNGPIALLCSDGLGRSGTLAAIMYALERVRGEGVLDVSLAIRTMRVQRPHMVKYMDQFKFIHYAINEYQQAFDDCAVTFR